MKALMLGLAAGVLLAGASATMAEVKIKGKNEQDVKVRGAVVNAAVGMGSTARQSLSSNVGQVSVGKDNKQTVDIKGAVINGAVGMGAKAEQALGSNVSH
jgi:hypothetical protein